MYIVCPMCNTASWIPMGHGVRVQYLNGDVIISQFKLNKRQINWSCSCFKDKQKAIKESTESTSEEAIREAIEK